MAQIFLSYARKDARIVDQLIARLETAGYEVWVDRTGIPGGEQWRRQIVRAIESSEAFLIVLSPHSVVSDNVRKELDLAEGAQKRVLPVFVQPVDIPAEMKYQLVGLQRIDLATDFDTGFQVLLRALAGSPGAGQGVSQPASVQTGTSRKKVGEYLFCLVIFGVMAAVVGGLFGGAIANLMLGTGGEPIGVAIGAVLALVTVLVGAWLQGFRAN